MTHTQKQFDALPSWAQAELRHLDREVERLQAKVAAIEVGDEDTGVTIAARTWGDKPVRLPKHAAITYQVGDDRPRPISVGYDMYGRFEVRSYGTIKITPRASNVITVEVEE